MKSEPIRLAIGAGDYTLAASLWQEWVAELHASGDLVDFRAAAQLAKWSREVLLCARAHTVDRLNALYVAGEYGNALSRGGSKRGVLSSQRL
jgi:hypothetical protein